MPLDSGTRTCGTPCRLISVSLVYAASRHEPIRPLLKHAFRVGLWLIGFLLVGIAVLAVFSWYMNG